jgi:hypothetical protein
MSFVASLRRLPLLACTVLMLATAPYPQVTLTGAIGAVGIGKIQIE